MLRAQTLSKHYLLGEHKLWVIKEVSLSAAQGEFLVIQGKSGSGKTTLLSLLSGLDQPTSGRININGKEITALSEDALAPFRNRTLGFVFQSFHLIPALSAVENVMFPAELKRDPAAFTKAADLFAQVGLEGRMDHLPHQLSGGEQQRVAICRAMINNPKILFADEPTGNLDSENGRAVLKLLLALKQQHDTTLVLATHSRDIAQTADRVIRLHDGRIESGNDRAD